MKIRLNNIYSKDPEYFIVYFDATLVIQHCQIPITVFQSHHHVKTNQSLNRDSKFSRIENLSVTTLNFSWDLKVRTACHKSISQYFYLDSDLKTVTVRYFLHFVYVKQCNQIITTFIVTFLVLRSQWGNWS